MIEDLDQVLEKLLKREIPIKNREVDFAFDLPKREWSSKLNRPTLNLFLHDLRENATLRQPEWQVERNGDGSVSKQRSPVRVDLHYMITAWAEDPGDEHHLLARTVMALYRNPTLPDDLLPEILQDQPVAIPLRVAEHDQLRSPADIWSALDNELRPAISCMITLALNPYQRFTGPLVRTRELRFGLADGLPLLRGLNKEAGQDRFWMVGGMVHADDPLEDARVALIERGLEVVVKENGQFVIGNLEQGEYTLELLATRRAPSRHTIKVPSEEGYDIKA